MHMNKLLNPEAAPVVQEFGSLAPVRLALPDEVRHQSIAALNRLLAHATSIRDQYRKSHWQACGANFYELHLLFERGYSEQDQAVDILAERVQALGGVALALPRDIHEESRLARGPRGAEGTVAQLLRLVESHEFILQEGRPMARSASERGDDGTADLIVSEVIRPNERQSWMVSRHLTGRRTS
jgi:starvation-inducible DNA-binding protein